MRSTRKYLIHTALADQDSDLERFVTDGLRNGKSVEDLWAELRDTTGVRFSLRTFQRWVADIKAKAA